MIGKLTRTILRTFAFALALCATGQAWATPYVTTGYEAFGSTAGVVLWRATQGNFHESTVIDVAADGTLGTPYAMLSDNGAKSWQRFASGQTAYESPGKVLVYDTAGTYTRNSDATFYPITFGGLWVKSLASDGGPFTISGTGNRTSQFGADNNDTYFKFDKSFTINRQGTVTFKGKATVDIATDATFWAQYYTGQIVSVPEGAELVLTGGGTYASNGTTVDGTLNISAATRPTISGNVTLSAGSTLVLPAGIAKNATVSIAVCSGTLTASGMVNVKIGTDDAVSAELVVSGGTITKILTARTYTTTVSGEKNLSALTWELDSVECDPVFGVSANAEVTVSAASTITIDNATTMATLKLLGSADLTITTSSQLTLAALNLSEYTGNVTISGTAFTLANGGLTGAATLILDPGAGNTYTMSQSNTGYTGEAIIKSGTVKMGNATSFGPIPRSSSIRVKTGSALDANNVTNGSYDCDKNKVVLEEGAKFCTSVSQADYKQSAFTKLTLEGDATVDATSGSLSISQHYNYDYTQLNLGEHTLSKIGSNEFSLSAVQILGSGVIDIENGAIVIWSSYYNTRPSTMQDGTLCIRDGAYLKLKDYTGQNAGGGVLTVKNLELDGSVTRDSATYSTLTVTGYISGTGTTPMLTLANGATLKPKSSTGGLTVTESLALSGSVNIDLSEVNLSDKADGTYFAILTAPADAAFDTTGIGLTRGANSTGWVLYSRETAAESGIYELGVYLTPDVTWSGASGTWTDTSFNGGSGNYTTGQQVVFSDSGASTEALAVTVDGAKNVSALDFTADNRNVTLSGDTITAGTVSKSGDGIATVNSTLSVTTSISVGDGVLVLNPTAAIVSDGWTESDNGTLVVYVDSGVTTTISAAITAKKLIKRGSGTLVLSAANTISDRITVSGGTLKASTNVGCFGGESIPVYVEDGGAVDINNVRILNRVYIIGDGPDGNGAYINTGDSTKQNGAHEGGMQGNISNKLTLTGDASIGGDSTIHFGSNSSIDVGTYTLTKKGVFWLPLNNTTISGTGKIVIEAGDFSNNNRANYLTGIDLEITGGTLDMAAGNSMSVKGFKSATAINGNTATLIVNGKIVANGTLTIPKLQLNDGASIELESTSSKVAVSSEFTFASGGVTCQFADGVTPGNATFLDLSALNLEGAPAGSFVLSSTLAEEYLPSKTATGFSIAKGYASITDSGVTTPYADALTLAMNMPESYDYITVLGTGNVSLYWLDGIKIKNPNSATLAFIGLQDDCVASPSTVDDITTYTKAATPTTYTWTGNARYYDQWDDELNQLPDPRWTSLRNWTFVNSSSATEIASRYPTTGDTVVFNDGAVVEVTGDITIAGMTVNGGMTLDAESACTLTIANDIDLAASSASLAVNSNVTLSKTPVTSVVGKCVVSSTSDGTTTYSVANTVAQIGDNKYGSLSLAIAAASNNDTITLAADCEDAVDLGGKTITLAEGDYTFSGSFTGNGTLVLPDGTLLKSPSPDRWASGWTGTVWIRNYTSLTGKSIQSGNTYGATSFEPNDYGNINSTVKFTGVKGYFTANNVVNYTIQPALELEDDGETPGLLLYNGWGYNSNVQCYTSIRELKGSGTLEADNTTPASSVLLQVQNWDDFTGTLTLPKKTVVFGSTLPVQTEVDGGGCIAVQSGASVEVPAGKTWTVGSGVVVYGNLSLGTGAAIVNTTVANTWIKCGAGKVTLNALGDLPATPASTWQGTIVLPTVSDVGESGFDFSIYGVNGSTIEIANGFTGWLKRAEASVRPAANFNITSAFTITGTSAETYVLKKISGTGDFTVSDIGNATSFSISLIDGFSGKIVNTLGTDSKKIVITRLNIDSDPTVAKETKILSSTTADKITVQSVYYNDEQVDLSRSLSIVNKADGVYIVRAGTIFSVY